MGRLMFARGDTDDHGDIKMLPSKAEKFISPRGEIYVHGDIKMPSSKAEKFPHRFGYILLLSNYERWVISPWIATGCHGGLYRGAGNS